LENLSEKTPRTSCLKGREGEGEGRDEGEGEGRDEGEGKEEEKGREEGKGMEDLTGDPSERLNPAYTGLEYRPI
jgi:hypothetical protein